MIPIRNNHGSRRRPLFCVGIYYQIRVPNPFSYSTLFLDFSYLKSVSLTLWVVEFGVKKPYFSPDLFLLFIKIFLEAIIFLMSDSLRYVFVSRLLLSFSAIQS